MSLRRWLPVLLLALAALACQTVLGATAPAPYQGAFDCSGTEAGLSAYAGRVTINPDGTAAFRDYDDQTQTGSWTYNQQTATLSFGGSLPLLTAIHDPAADTLVVVLLPGASVVHAEGGSLACQRSEPGVTGPP